MSVDSDTPTLGARSTAWRASKGYSLDPARVMVKITEELGEVARALTGDFEDRPGRGDVLEEAAQTVIVLASLVHIHCGEDLLAAVEAEMAKHGA